MKQKIVNFCGQMNNGKDECVNFLIANMDGWKKVAFGEAVKQTFEKAFGVDRRFTEEWKRQNDPPPGFLKTVRETLQFIGDGFRKVRPSVWIDKLFDSETEGNLAICDGRYYSELRGVCERDGINVLVVRPGFENDIDHPSESQLRPEADWLFRVGAKNGIVTADSPINYLIVNDGTIDDLRDKVVNGLIPFIEDWFTRHGN